MGFKIKRIFENLFIFGENLMQFPSTTCSSKNWNQHSLSNVVLNIDFGQGAAKVSDVNIGSAWSGCILLDL